MISLLLYIVIPSLIIIIAGSLVLLVKAFIVPSKTIILDLGDTKISTQSGVTILQALNDNNIFIPSGCGGKGSCGYCKVKVIEGKVPILPTDKAWISNNDLEKGWRLACQHRIYSEIKLDIPKRYLNVKKVEAKLIKTQMLTPDIKELVLLPQTKIKFRAGQYIQVDINNTGETRAYSISNEEGSKELVLNVRLVKGGLGSTWLHSIDINKRLMISGPYGEYSLPSTQGLQLILVGGGVGVAPISSLIRTVVKKRQDIRLRVFLGFRSLKHAYYLEEFKKLTKKHPDFELYVALDSEEQKGFFKGFVHEMIDQEFFLIKTSQQTSVFLCGPPPMIKAAQQVLNKKGIPFNNMFYDKF